MRAGLRCPNCGGPAGHDTSYGSGRCTGRRRGSKRVSYAQRVCSVKRVSVSARAFYAFLRAQGVSEKTIRVLQRKTQRGNFRLRWFR